MHSARYYLIGWLIHFTGLLTRIPWLIIPALICFTIAFAYRWESEK